MGKNDLILPDDTGELRLNAGKHFHVKVFHCHPKSNHAVMDAPLGEIQVQFTDKLLVPVALTPLEIDSPYDLKAVAFRTSDDSATTRSGTLVIRSTAVGGTTLDRTQPELVLPVRVPPPLARMFVGAAILAVLIFAQQYVVAASKGPVDFGTTITLLGLASLTGIAALFALKKPS